MSTGFTKTKSTTSSSGKLNLKSPNMNFDDITASYTKVNSKDFKHNDDHENNEDLRNYLKRSVNFDNDRRNDIETRKNSPQTSLKHFSSSNSLQLSPNAESAEFANNNNNNNNSNNNNSSLNDTGIDTHESEKDDQELKQRNIKKLPKNFKYCQTDDLLILVSRMLESLMSINDQSEQNFTSSNLTRFHSRVPPNISVYSYLSRLTKFSNIENSILLSSIYYIDLLSNAYNSFTLNSLTVHRFLLTATTVGSKGLCDSFCTNYHYAKVGGVLYNELNLLEMEFLQKVNWRIVPQIVVMNKVKEEDTNNIFREKLIPISDAEKVLDMYYKQLISLTGHLKSINDDIYVLSNEDVIPFNSREDHFKQQKQQQLQQLQQQQQQQRSIYSSRANKNLKAESLVKLSPLKRSADPIIDAKMKRSQK